MVYHLITPLIASNKLNRAVRELRKGGVEVLDESVAAPVFAPPAWEHQEGTSWGSLVSSHICFDEKDNGCHAWRVIFYPNTEFYIWDIWLLSVVCILGLSFFIQYRKNCRNTELHLKSSGKQTKPSYCFLLDNWFSGGELALHFHMEMLLAGVQLWRAKESKERDTI